VLQLRERQGRHANVALVWRVASTEAWFQTMVDKGSAYSEAGRAEISALNW
jgi:hypothetical protein